MKFSLKSGHKGFILIALFGVIILAAAAIFQFVTDRKMNEWTHTEAKVAAYRREVEMTGDGDRKFVYKAVLAWTVDGVEYRGESADQFKHQPIIGVTYRIAYNPKNPQQFYEIDNGIWVKILLYGIGGILTCAGIGFFLFSCRTRLSKSKDK